VGIEQRGDAEAVVRRMMAAMQHRGPDDEGFARRASRGAIRGPGHPPFDNEMLAQSIYFGFRLVKYRAQPSIAERPPQSISLGARSMDLGCWPPR